MNECAIGVFDSGVGGLTVLKELLRLLPGEELVYLGDTARVPYGTKSPATVMRYALEAATFLASSRIKMLVVACNTASSVALGALEERFAFPVVGVIDPGARKAVSVTRNGKVGVIGTEGTIKSGAYVRAIKALNPEVEVFSAAAPLFVSLAEEGWVDHAVTRMVVREYVDPLLEKGIDTLVLGCTHYPLLKGPLQDVVGRDVVLVDSAEETARTVKTLLCARDILRSSPPRPPRFFVTDASERFERVGGSFLGLPLEGVSQVELDGFSSC